MIDPVKCFDCMYQGSPETDLMNLCIHPLDGD